MALIAALSSGHSIGHARTMLASSEQAFSTLEEAIEEVGGVSISDRSSLGIFSA